MKPSLAGDQTADVGPDPFRGLPGPSTATYAGDLCRRAFPGEWDGGLPDTCPAKDSWDRVVRLRAACLHLPASDWCDACIRMAAYLTAGMETRTAAEVRDAQWDQLRAALEEQEAARRRQEEQREREREGRARRAFRRAAEQEKRERAARLARQGGAG